MEENSNDITILCAVIKKICIHIWLTGKNSAKITQKKYISVVIFENHKILKQNQETAAGPQGSFNQYDLEHIRFELFVENKCWSLHNVFLI